MENANNNETLLARWLAGSLKPSELEALQQREDFADLQQVVEGVKELETPAFSENDSWEKLQGKLRDTPKEKIEHSEIPIPSLTVSKSNREESPSPTLSEKPAPIRETPVRHLFRRQWIMGIAAAVAVFVVALWWIKDDSPTYNTMIATGIGEQQNVTLPDGSTLTLNALSKIGYNETDWPDDRQVYLEGEAHFKAKKGKTFTVRTGQGQVKVVGTAFNVFARGDVMEVKCTHGTVQAINPKGTEKALVKAGEQVAVLNGRMQKRRGLDYSPKWFKGESVFKSAARNRVFKEMERQYGIIVTGKNLQGSPFTGKFVHDDLQKALKMISVPMELDYEVSSDTVRFFVRQFKLIN